MKGKGAKEIMKKKRKTLDKKRMKEFGMRQVKERKGNRGRGRGGKGVGKEERSRKGKKIMQVWE